MMIYKNERFESVGYDTDDDDEGIDENDDNNFNF